MPIPGEHKTVQARILQYVEAIGFTIVPHEEAEQRRGFEFPSPSGLQRSGSEGAPTAKGDSPFFDDLLHPKVREFNPRYADASVSLLGEFRHPHIDIHINPPLPEGFRFRFRSMSYGGQDGSTGMELLERQRNRRKAL